MKIPPKIDVPGTIINRRYKRKFQDFKPGTRVKSTSKRERHGDVTFPARASRPPVPARAPPLRPPALCRQPALLAEPPTRLPPNPSQESTRRPNVRPTSRPPDSPPLDTPPAEPKSRPDPPTQRPTDKPTDRPDHAARPTPEHDRPLEVKPSPCGRRSGDDRPTRPCRPSDPATPGISRPTNQPTPRSAVRPITRRRLSDRKPTTRPDTERPTSNDRHTSRTR